MTRVVHLVADYGAGDPAFARVVERLALALPDAVVHSTVVAPRDTWAAGLVVARLALGHGAPQRVVVHDVADEPGPRSGAEPARYCVGRSPVGVLVVGRNTGWSWSFVVDDLRGPCYLDLPAIRSPERLTEAIAQVIAGHPRAVRGLVPRAHIPRVPARTRSTPMTSRVRALA